MKKKDIDMFNSNVEVQLNKANDQVINEVESRPKRTIVTPNKWKDFVLYQ